MANRIQRKYSEQNHKPVTREYEPRNRHIPRSLRFKIWAMHCVICGSSGNIEIDHIRPISDDGTSAPENLQPLCRFCHVKKKNRLTNEELRAWAAPQLEELRLKNEWLSLQSHVSFDASAFARWKAARNA